MAVLTAYPTRVRGSLGPGFRSTRSTFPLMCGAAEGADDGLLVRMGGAMETELRGLRPMPSAGWAAGFSFSRGHRVADVPNAGNAWLFHGEEWHMFGRLWVWLESLPTSPPHAS